MDAIDIAIAKMKATVPGSFARADEASIDAGARHLLSMPHDIAIRRIAERIYDPHGFALRSPQPKPLPAMLDHVRELIAASEPLSTEPFGWHERRNRLLIWKECRRALITMIYEDDASEPVALAEAAE